MSSTYTTSQGDTWDVISLEHYGTEVFASELIKANYEHRDVAIFSAGIVLTIPTIAAASITNTNLPPWRR